MTHRRRRSEEPLKPAEREAQARNLLRNATYKSLDSAVRVAHMAGLPPSEICELTGYPYATINGIINESRRPGPEQLPF